MYDDLLGSDRQVLLMSARLVFFLRKWAGRNTQVLSYPHVVDKWSYMKGKVAGVVMFLGCPSIRLYRSCELSISGRPWGIFFKFSSIVHLVSKMNCLLEFIASLLQHPYLKHRGPPQARLVSPIFSFKWLLFYRATKICISHYVYYTSLNRHECKLQLVRCAEACDRKVVTLVKRLWKQ